MNALRLHLRRHRWQRRALTVLLAATVGLLAANLAYPPIQHARREAAYQRVLQEAAAANPGVRAAARSRAAALATEREDFRALLERTLASPDDQGFLAAAEAIQAAGAFDVPARPGAQRARLERIRFAQAQPAADSPADPLADARARAIVDFVLQQWDDGEARRLLALALADPDARVRSEAAVLAGLLADDAALAGLLADVAPPVRARAAAVAAMAGRHALAPAVLERLELARDDEEFAAMAHAAARLAPEQASCRIVDRLETAPPRPLRDRLLWVATRLPPPSLAPLEDELREWAAPAPEDAEAAPAGDPLAAVMPLLLIAEQRATPLAPAVQDALATRGPRDVYWRADALAAAARAADRLDLPAHEALLAILRDAPREPDAQPLLMQAAAALAGGAGDAPPGAEEALAALALEREAVPLAAAAAALALWRVSPERGAAAIEHAAGAEATLAGDWLAWRLAEADPQAAVRTGYRLLHVGENDRARGAGAMMLALATHGTPGASAAAEVIARLLGPPYPDDAILGETYRCALLLCGEGNLAPAVERLLLTGSFPQRRALTALLLTRPAVAADWLLADPQLPTADLDAILGGRRLAEVLRAAYPSLPRYEPLAPPTVRLWQIDLLRDAYRLSR